MSPERSKRVTIDGVADVFDWYSKHARPVGSEGGGITTLKRRGGMPKTHCTFKTSDKVDTKTSLVGAVNHMISKGS
ncbi:hypothetical protein E5D57_005380 [Metarhizium anisopliae]|nr:hypothetical protein E5D57_005380 [Metarhizium anisopliae]